MITDNVTTPPSRKTVAKKAPVKRAVVKGTGQPTNRALSTAKPIDPKSVVSLSASAAPATAGSKLRGYEGQVYYGLSTATEAIFANVVDFDLDVKADSIDASDRSTTGWKDKLGGLKEWTGTIKANAIQAGIDVAAFYGALVNGATMTGSFRPQDVTGGLAYTGSFVITSYKHASPNSGLQTIDLSIEGRGPLVLGTVTTGGSATP